MFTTIEDVALAAGCSPATVSRVINGSALVSEDVRAKVSEAVRQTGYTPRRRRSAAPKTEPRGGMPVVNILFYRNEPYETLRATPDGVKVGALHAYHAPDLQSAQFRRSNSFEQGLLEGMLAACSHYRLKAGIISADDLEDPLLLEEVGKAGGGLVIGGIYPEGLDAFLAQCRQPVVLLDILHDGTADVITSDNIGGIRQSVRHLLGLGHTKIGFIGKDNPSYMERHYAFVAAMAEAGCKINPAFVVRTQRHIADTAHDLEPLFTRKARPTALVTASDYLAIAAMEAAHTAGLRVPEDLSIIGFDNVSVARRTRPGLTTIHVPVQELGWRAVAQLVPLTQEERPRQHMEGAIVRVRTTLIERGTCAPPPKEK